MITAHYEEDQGNIDWLKLVIDTEKILTIYCNKRECPGVHVSEKHDRRGEFEA